MGFNFSNQFKRVTRHEAFIWLLAFSFATVFYLSLDLNEHDKRLYVAEVAPNGESGQLKLVFYGDSYSRLGGDRVIAIPLKSWVISGSSG